MREYKGNDGETRMRRFSQWFLQWFFMFGLVALVLTCLVLASCVSGGARMKHPVTGKTVECGRYAWVTCLGIFGPGKA